LLTKPASPDDLVVLVQQLLSQHGIAGRSSSAVDTSARLAESRGHPSFDSVAQERRDRPDDMVD
jgi:hypothetical protein